MKEPITIHYLLLHGVAWGALGCLSAPFLWRLYLPPVPAQIVEGILMFFALLILVFHRDYKAMGILFGVCMLLVIGRLVSADEQVPGSPFPGVPGAPPSGLFGLIAIYSSIYGIILAKRDGLSHVNYDFFVTGLVMGVGAVLLTGSCWLLEAQRLIKI